MSKRWDKKKRSKLKNTLRDDAYRRLNGLYQAGKGRSRRLDKAKKIDSQYIYSSRTYETYKANSKLFINWILKQHPEVRHLKECAPYANEWIESQIISGYSPWTVATRKAAISKLLDIPYCDLITTPSRCRAQIQRSRARVERDRHISNDKEAFYAMITSATGLRRNELLKIRGTDLKSEISKDGSVCYYLHITRGTKGGRIRDSIVMGSTVEETLHIVNLFRAAGNHLICPKIPNAYDNHHFRAIYAKRLYGQYARPIETIPREDRYIMRKDRAGEVLDRKAMLIVFRNLGHSRPDVIAQNYLY